jgi:hypothetical protein
LEFFLKVLYLFALVFLLAACAAPVPTKPSAPSAVIAASGTAVTRVTWQDKSNNENGFVIYRDTLLNNSSDPNLVATSLEKIAEVTANTTYFEDKTTNLEARYIYYVAARNDLGASETVRQDGDPVRVRPAFEAVVGSANTKDWRFPQPVTAYLFLVHEDAAKPKSDVVVTVSGPQGWNNNHASSFTMSPSQFSRDLVRVAPNLSLESGTYTVSAVVNGQTYTTQSVVSKEAVLGVSKVGFQLTNSNSNAGVNWEKVTGAKSYFSYLGASDINVRGVRTLSLNSEFNSLKLGPAEYTGRVYALNYDATAKEIERPFPQFMVSVGESDLTLVPFTGSTFFKVDPAARYLEGDSNDTGKPATALSLTQIGAAPGECVGLMRAGAFKSDALKLDLFPDMISVFRGNTGLLNPGALGNQSSEYTSPTAQGKEIDIPEDFLVPGRQIAVQIPEGATELLVSADDVRNSDNSDPNNDFGVLVAKVSCPSAAQLQSYALNDLK